MDHLIIAANGKLQADCPLSRIEETLADPHALLWLDIQDPSDKDAILLHDVFNFHPLAIEDALRSVERPKVDVFRAAALTGRLDEITASELVKAVGDGLVPGAYYFVVFYSAEYDATERQINVDPFNLFIGANYLVTVHRGAIRQIGETQARFLAPTTPIEPRIGPLTYSLLDAVVDDYFPLMDHVADQAEELEDAIFIEVQPETFQTIFALKRDLLKLRHIVAPERDVMNVLLRREIPVFKARDMIYFQDIYDHIVRLTDVIDTYRELTASAVDSYLSVQSHNLNQIVKALTIGSILLMSAALIAGIYGMNFEYMPELNQKWGYPWALGLMAAVTAGLALFFKRRGWF